MISLYSLKTFLMIKKAILCSFAEIPLGIGCRYTGRGYEYFGTQNTTATGKQCVRWDANLPHFIITPIENVRFAEDFVKSWSDLGNYCRNFIPLINGSPTLDGTKPWCYTNTSKENCDIPFCGK